MIAAAAPRFESAHRSAALGFLSTSEAEFYISRRDGKPVGTICAAVDRQANAERNVRECVFGFLHFIQDFAAVQALLEPLNTWARNRD
jgi:hypothetical protein